MNLKEEFMIFYNQRRFSTLTTASNNIIKYSKKYLYIFHYENVIGEKYSLSPRKVYSLIF